MVGGGGRIKMITLIITFTWDKSYNLSLTLSTSKHVIQFLSH